MQLSRRHFATLLGATSALPGRIAAQNSDSSPVSSPVIDGASRTVFHSARITALVPAELQPAYPNQDLYVAGPEEFIFVHPVAAQSTDALMQGLAGAAQGNVDDFIDVDLNGVAGKMLESVTSTAIPAPATLVIAQYPEPFAQLASQMTHLVIELTPEFAESFIPTVSLDLSDVTPAEYLDGVLDIAQGNSLVMDDVDWDSIRTQVKSDVSSMDEAHEFLDGTILKALEEAGDHHTRFVPMEASGGTEATPGATPVPDPMPTATTLEDGTLLLTLPQVAGGDLQAYVDICQQALEQHAQAENCKGVIVDLRINHGGIVFVMVAALAPLIPTGEIYGYQYPNQPKPEMWTKEMVLDFLEQNTGIVTPDIDLGQLPVAILMGTDTASSAELTAISFIGRENTQSFGMKSGGYTTANNTYSLLDGWVMNLAASVMTDRTGQTYGESLTPDSEVEFTADQIGTANDPVIPAATDWLNAQPCVLPGRSPDASPVPR